MRAVVQRVTSARVSVEGVVTGEVGPGLLVFVAIARDDTLADGEWLAGKIARLRVFEAPDGRMNTSLLDTGGGALVISQFTLYGDVRKGSRPSYNEAAPPAEAEALYGAFTRQLSAALGRPVATGRFAAQMQVSLVNDGPVTVIVDTPRRVGREDTA
jgi:D-tyrosyl-tRNA(Tyr) deacylase